MAIVAVRFFGLARPLARYLERLASHDLALRALGRVRARFYERIEPLAPPSSRASASGDLLARMVADVDALQDLYLRASARRSSRSRLARVCVGGDGGVPAGRGGRARRGAARRRARRARSSRAPRPRGRARQAAPARRRPDRRDRRADASRPGARGLRREERTLERIRRCRPRSSARLAPRGALVGGLGDGLAVLVGGLTVVGVLAVSVRAHETGALDGVLVAMLALLAFASFEAVDAAAGGRAGALGDAGRRPARARPDRPRAGGRDPEPPACPSGVPSVELSGVTARYGRDEPRRARGFQPPARAGQPRCACRAEWRGQNDRRQTSFSASSIPEKGRVTLGGHAALRVPAGRGPGHIRARGAGGSRV